ncbi:pilus assembly protein TadE [Rathayibacter sp. Leaf299]|uniref:TadE/TadG family type IV pilus assembly protein n=1 Tax=unclassified Rathayibacter TaxID=2609250 RepID=UPI0006FB997C|nr:MULTISPECIES: TadE family protein [unclassified Rathayibacter]KQQ20870.1 pilus assembly protein TadE [Rathayibacter sp. Leaf299]
MSSRLHEDSGAVALEFALLLPILMVILVGIVEFSLLFTAQTTITNAAREGARSMALHNNPATARTAVKNAAFNLSPGLTDAQITVSPTACTVGTLGTTTIRYQYHLMTGLFGDGITLTGKAAMRCGG